MGNCVCEEGAASPVFLVKGATLPSVRDAIKTPPRLGEIFLLTLWNFECFPNT